MKIVVRRAHRLDGLVWPRYGGGWFRAVKVWQVYGDGERLPFLVVQGAPPAPFKTILSTKADPMTPVTCWHIGIGPGDLARLKRGILEGNG